MNDRVFLKLKGISKPYAGMLNFFIFLFFSLALCSFITPKEYQILVVVFISLVITIFYFYIYPHGVFELIEEESDYFSLVYRPSLKSRVKKETVKFNEIKDVSSKRRDGNIYMVFKLKNNKTIYLRLQVSDRAGVFPSYKIVSNNKVLEEEMSKITRDMNNLKRSFLLSHQVDYSLPIIKYIKATLAR